MAFKREKLEKTFKNSKKSVPKRELYKIPCAKLLKTCINYKLNLATRKNCKLWQAKIKSWNKDTCEGQKNKSDKDVSDTTIAGHFFLGRCCFMHA